MVGIPAESENKYATDYYLRFFFARILEILTDIILENQEQISAQENIITI
jgi:hypothetical protein